MDISKSQKRHLKKVQKNHEKRELRKQKQLEEQRRTEERGIRIIKENNNQGPYSPEYTLKASEFYYESIQKAYLESLGQKSPASHLYHRFQELKSGIQDLLILWSDQVERDLHFFFFKELLDCYRDHPKEADPLWNYTLNVISGFIRPKVFEKEYESRFWEITGKTL